MEGRVGPVTRVWIVRSLVFTGLVLWSSVATALPLSRSLGRSTFVLIDTALYAWGDNGYNQLGLDRIVYGTVVKTPSMIHSPSGSMGWKQIAAGLNHTLAVTMAGTLYGFGNTATGRLANAAGSAPEQIPVPAGSTSWELVACGYDHSLAITNTGKLYAFGSNAWGQLGVGDNADRSSPTEVPKPAGVSAWTAAWAGAYHSFAMGDDGKIYAWGWNFYGQLGIGSTTQQLTPVAISNPANMGVVSWVAAGYGSTYAITSTGKLFVWGRNDTGQLGITGTTVYKPTEVPFPSGVTGFSGVSCGTHHMIVTTTTQKVYVTGLNGDGQLGDGTTTTRTTLTQVLRADGSAVLGTGWAADNASYVFNDVEGVWAWGLNAYKQAGDTNVVSVLRPRKIEGINGGGGPYNPADTTCLYSEDQIVIDDPNGTQLLQAGADDTTSSVQNIGFTFRFKGVDYTTFTVSSNGLIGLGSTPVVSTAANNLSALSTPTLVPFWDDLVLGPYSVMIQHLGQGANRSLQITWRGRVKQADTNVQSGITIHATLEEATQSARYAYSYGGNTASTSASIGWSVDGRWVSFTPGRPWTQSTASANNAVNLGTGQQYTNTVVVDDSCTPPPPPPPTGVTYTRTQLSVIVDLTNVWFITDLEGFVVGSGGRLFRTIDGGLSWTLVSTGTTVDLTGFRIINGRWYVFGAGGIVLYSTNFGASWITINTGVNVTITDVRFLNEHYGVAIGHGGVILIWNGVEWIRQAINVSASVRFTSVYIYGTTIYVTGTSGHLWRFDGTTWVRVSLNLNIDITSITMIDGLFGYLIGSDGTICRTFDGGLTWSVQISGVNVTLRNICIVSKTIAYVVGDGGIFLQTLDGGRTWVRIDLNTSIDLRSVTVVGGWGTIVGVGGVIFRFRSDYVVHIHGTTFSRMFTNVNVNLGRITFIDGSRGLMIGDGGVILRTIDGGASWISVNIGINIRITGVRVINGIAWICGHNGYVAYSSDGGQTWIRIDLNVSVNFTGLVFINASYGFLIGEGGVIYRFDGITWIRENINTTRSFRQITVVGSFVWAIGDGGIVWRFDGRSWLRIDIGVTTDLIDITFIDARIGWIVGKGGLAWRTIDGGRTWTSVVINVGVGVEIRSLRFASRWIGWAACARGIVLQTIDGGHTWVRIDLGIDVDLLNVHYERGIGYVGGADGMWWIFNTQHLIYMQGVHVSRLNLDINTDLRHCRFLDAYTGIVVGADGVLRITFNGGLTWLRRDLGTTFRWNNVSIVDSIFFVVGDNGCIYRSMDLGLTWYRFPLETTEHFYSIALLHRNEGFAVGRNGSIWRYNGSRWLRMTVSTSVTFSRVFVSGHVCFAVGQHGALYRWNGSLWISVTSSTSADLCDVAFYDALFGLVVGDGGTILRTVNGGDTWVKVSINLNVRINAIHIVSRELIFAVCNGGTLLRSIDGGTTWIQIRIGAEDLTAISFSGGIGWIVGISGRCYAFTDDIIDAVQYSFSMLKRGIRFDGENTFVDLGRKSSYGVTKSLSLMAWIHPVMYGKISGIVGNHRYAGAGSKGHSLLLDEFGHVGMVVTVANGTAKWLWTDSTIKLDRWSHVAGVFDGTSMRVYINGVLRSTTTFSQTLLMATDDRMMIGWYQGYRRSYFNGSIDAVSIWGAPCPPSHIRRGMHERTVGIEPWLMGSWEAQDDQQAYVVSGSPIERSPVRGVGRSWSGVISSRGNYYLAGTDTRIDVATVTSNVDIAVHSIVDMGGITAPAGCGRLFPRTWVIRTYGHGSFSGSWKIVIGPNGSSVRDAAEPAKWVLYRRNADGSGNWVLAAVCTGVDQRTGTLTFPMLSWDGQYILGCNGDSPLELNLDAKVTVQPVDAVVCEDGSAEFSVITSGTNLRYQWRKDGKTIDGANDHVYRIQPALLADRAAYDVVIDAQTTMGATSLTRSLQINVAPSIQAQPAGMTVCAGQMIDVGVVASGTEVTYQWRRNGVPIAGANTYRLTIPSASDQDRGWYHVLIGGACVPWLISDSVYVGVMVRPAIIRQPRDTSVVVGENVHLAAAADSGNVSYQWRRNGSPIIGATEPTLDIDSAQLSDSAEYDVIVTGPCGSDTSRSAKVNVRVVVSHVDGDVNTDAFALIYPQPASSSVTIDLSRVDPLLLRGAACLLVNANGHVVLDLTPQMHLQGGSMTDIDISSLASGLYSCIVRNAQISQRVGSVAVLR